MVNYKEKLDEAIHLTQQKGFEQTRAEWLMLDVFQWTRTDFVVHMHDDMPKAMIMKFDLALQRMLLGEPIQYIVGFASFYGRTFDVNSNCLIPRPETEEVMLHFLQQLEDDATIVDIGTGSGVLAITMKCEKPDLNVIATDISLEAMNVARNNAEKHQSQIQFLTGDALKPLIKEGIKLNGLISNPPYIDEKIWLRCLQRLRDSNHIRHCLQITMDMLFMNQSLKIYLTLWKKAAQLFLKLVTIKVRHLNQ